MKTFSAAVALFALLVFAGNPDVSFAGEPRLIALHHPHDDHIIAYHLEDMLAAPIDQTGESDASSQIQAAIDAVYGQGGGNLFLPAGRYRLDHPLTLPPTVGLRGEFSAPRRDRAPDWSRTSLFVAFYGRDQESAEEALINLDGSASIDGFAFWYPEQRPDAIVPYAPTIRHTDIMATWAVNTTSRNLHFVNAYHGIQVGSKTVFTVIQLMKNITGSPLATGIEVWKDADIPRILNLDLSPDYWAASGLPGAPDFDGAHRRHIYEQATGVRYHRCDGSELAKLTIEGYHIGMELLNGTQRPNGHWTHNEGHYLDFNIHGGQYALWIDNIKGHGTQFYQSRLHGDRSAIHVNSPMPTVQLAMFAHTRLEGGETTISTSWNGEPSSLFSFIFSDCEFGSRVEWNGGTLQVTHSRFQFDGPHIILGEGISEATLVDNQYQGGRQIINPAGDRAVIHDRSFAPRSLARYDYRVNLISSYRPTRAALVSVSDFGARAGADIGPVLQAAIDAVHADGGGYVLVPSGDHLLQTTVTIKPGVEVTGVLDFWHHSKIQSILAEVGTPKGTLIRIEPRDPADQTPTFTLETGSGLTGMLFHHPGITYDPETDSVSGDAPWVVRLEGSGAYAKHLTTVNALHFVDVADAAADTYLGYLNGAPLRHGLHLGESPRAMVDNVHFNSWYWNTVEFANKPSEIHPEFAYQPELDNWMKSHTHAFTLRGSRDLDMYGSFMFCTRQAFTLLPGRHSGRGPSGIVINSGNDWAKYGLFAHANDGLRFVNMHFIDVNKNDPDAEIASIYFAPEMRDAVELTNVSTWGTSWRVFSLHGTPESRLSITNLSYYLYNADQDNRLHGGHLELRNVVRRVAPFQVGWDFGSLATAEFHAVSLPAPLSTNLPDEKIWRDPRGETAGPATAKVRLVDRYGRP